MNIRELIVACACATAPSMAAAGVIMPHQPPGLYDPAVQKAELHKLQTNPSAALADPFWTYVDARRDLNPVRFDHYHPNIGPILGVISAPSPVPASRPPVSLSPVVPIETPPIIPPSVTPIVPPPSPVIPPPVITPPSHPGHPHPGEAVPEPSSAVSALVGMAVCLGWYRWKMRKH